MSNPYLSFLASLGGSTGSHSTLQKLAATSSSPSPSTSSSISSSTTTNHRAYNSHSRPSTAPRPSAPPSSSSSGSKHSRHSSSSHSYSSSHSHSQSHLYSRSSTSASKPRSSSYYSSSSYSNGGAYNREYKASSSSSNTNSTYGNSISYSRNHDRPESKNYGQNHDRHHSNGKSHVSGHRDDRDDSSSFSSSRNERKREREVDISRSDNSRSYARTSKDKDTSFSEPRVKKRHARSRSRSRSPSRTRSKSRSRSRSVSRTRTKFRQRSYSPRRNTTEKSRSSSRSRSRSRSPNRNRSPSPMPIMQISRSATPTISPAPESIQSASKSPAPQLTPVPQLSPQPTPATLPSTPPSLPQEQRPFLDLDDTSSFSTLSSPSSYSLSPPPGSAPSSPAKDNSPIKKRRMESLLHTEASYSSPSSLSSFSPDPSDRSSIERELEENKLLSYMAREVESKTTAQSSSDHAAEVSLSQLNTQQSLELELFGKVLSKPTVTSTNTANTTKKSNSASKTSNINGLKKQDSNLKRNSSSISSGSKSRRMDDTDDEEYGSLGSVVKNEMDPSKRSSGFSGAKRLSVDGVKTSREVIVINTERGTVISKIIRTLQKPLKSSNGVSQRPSKTISSGSTPKEISQKSFTSSATGATSRRLSILHSDQIVAAAMGRYKNHFHMLLEDSDSTVASNPSSTGGESMHVSVEYPGKDSREKFTLMKPFLSRSKTESDDKDEYNPIEDLVQTVRIIMEHFFTPEQYKELFGTANEGLYRSLTKYKNRKDGAQFLKAVEDFNQIMQNQKSSGKIQEHVRQYGHRLPYDLVVHLLQQVYSRTVAARASKLNQYEAFSNNVYGEILPNLTKEFIQRTKIDETKVFVDLGCGIGNVVLQVALQTGAESYGVEIMDTPAKFAKKQAKEFEARTRAFGLHHGEISMIHGDFLDTPGLPAILARADVVLVNNYAFDSALNQSLLQLFLDLKEGCKIISLKTFVSLDHKINVRNAGSVESILRVKKYPYYTNAVSWTHNGGEYFIATVDRSAVQAFWEKAMSDGGASLDDGGSRRSSTRRR